MIREQFNARISKGIKRRAINDRKRCNVTNDIVVEVALESFLTKFTPDQRAGFYRAHDHKPYRRAAFVSSKKKILGRKVKL
jgi:hypothetical protein